MTARETENYTENDREKERTGEPGTTQSAEAIDCDRVAWVAWLTD